MKHLKSYENNNFTIGDIVVCAHSLYKPTDEEYYDSPKIGIYYKVIFDNDNFFTIKDIETGQVIKHWNKRYFVSEEEWNANKYNI